MAPSYPQQFGPYTLHELFARGGMAEIYRATMPGIGGFEKTVAIKKILPHLAENEEFITMLIDEARIIVSINHANIAQVYDLGCIDDTYYIAMEYIHGVDLSGIVKALAKQRQHVPTPHAIYIGSAICAGLHAAHSKTDENGRPLNIVHRDISPHNVLLSFSGDVKIIDFGVAKASTKETHTKMGVIKGKILYMAPEQAMAVPDVDGRADLFAAGLVMYKMLTNRLPFEGDNEFQIYNNIISKKIDPPKMLNPEVPDALNAVVMKLLARDREHRYQDGYSAKQDLDRVLHQVAPGYTVNRLSRFVEDNFSDLLQRSTSKKEASGPSGIPLETPASNQLGTDPIGKGHNQEGNKTVRIGIKHAPQSFEQSPDWNAGAQAGVPASGSQGGYDTMADDVATQDGFRIASTDGDTGQLEAAALMAPPTPSKKGVPPVVYALLGMLFVLVVLAAVVIFKPTQAEIARDVPIPEPSAPAPVVEPVRMVQVTLDSLPQTARVYQDDRLIGITPLTLELEASEEALNFRFRKRGFADRTFELVPNDDLSQTHELITDADDKETEEDEAAALEEAAAEAQRLENQRLENQRAEAARAEAARAEARRREENAKKAAEANQPRKTSPTLPRTTRKTESASSETPEAATKSNAWIDIPTPPPKKTEPAREDKGGSTIIDPF